MAYRYGSIRFCSKSPGKEICALDRRPKGPGHRRFFSQLGGGRDQLKYAFPPFNLIQKCLQKVIEGRAQILLVAPVDPDHGIQYYWTFRQISQSTAIGSSLSSSSLGESTTPFSQSPQLQVSHVPSIKHFLLSQNIPERVSKILLAS